MSTEIINIMTGHEIIVRKTVTAASGIVLCKLKSELALRAKTRTSYNFAPKLLDTENCPQASNPHT